MNLLGQQDIESGQRSLDGQVVRLLLVIRASVYIFETKWRKLELSLLSADDQLIPQFSAVPDVFAFRVFLVYILFILAKFPISHPASEGHIPLIPEAFWASPVCLQAGCPFSLPCWVTYPLLPVFHHPLSLFLQFPLFLWTSAFFKLFDCHCNEIWGQSRDKILNSLHHVSAEREILLDKYSVIVILLCYGHCPRLLAPSPGGAGASCRVCCWAPACE